MTRWQPGLAEPLPVAGPRLLVLSSLFLSPLRPTAGVFIRERMFRVAAHLPIVVVSPQAWFPGQGLIRILRPGYRPSTPRCEQHQGITVYRPRFLAIPGMLRWLDGFSMGVCCYFIARRLRQQRGVNLIDAHFAYPEGEAAVWLGRWLDLPVTITLRDTEVRHSRQARLRQRVTNTLKAAQRVFAASDSLRQLAMSLGVPKEKTQVVSNGVDLQCFQRMNPHEARQKLDLPLHAQLLISVGALVERKGMHRVIDCLPKLLKDHPDLHYVVVGGASPEGDIRAALDAQVARLGLTERVHFLGSLAPNEPKWPLSAADVFVLATRNEGGANVFLEAMACGLQVVTTDVGGNAEVVCRPELGSIVPFDEPAALQAALHDALNYIRDRNALRTYAVANGWDDLVAILVREFQRLIAVRAQSPAYPGKIAGIKS